MSCCGCLCLHCARSCELSLLYFTPGELPAGTVACFNCIEYTGCRQRRLWREDCEGYIEARLWTERRAEEMRKKWRIIQS